MAILYFENGISVKELRELIKDWPEFDRDEEPTRVWVSVDKGGSSLVSRVASLNARMLDDETETADILLTSNEFR